MFEVEVLNGKSIYTIYRRYSQFLDLYEKVTKHQGCWKDPTSSPSSQLKHRFGTYAVPQRFPGKRFRNNLSPAAVDKRHMKLKAWCEAVAANETLAKSMELREFIKFVALCCVSSHVTVSDNEVLLGMIMPRLQRLFRLQERCHQFHRNSNKTSLHLLPLLRLSLVSIAVAEPGLTAVIVC